MAGGDGSAWWDRTAASYDRSMWLLGGPLPTAVAATRRAVQGRARVLEVAAGTGLFTEGIADVVGHLLATDYAPAMVERLRVRVQGRANVEVQRLDLFEHGAFPSDSFDAVVAANVLHLVDDLPGALANLHAWLRPGGRLVAPTYLHDAHACSRWLSSVMALGGFPGRRRFNLRSLARHLADAGFEVAETVEVGGLLPIGVVVTTKSA